MMNIWRQRRRRREKEANGWRQIKREEEKTDGRR